MRSASLRFLSALAAALPLALLTASASAEVPVKRTVTKVPSSNGHGAILLDLSTARLTHFREHLFATEEPLLDAAGKEQWSGFTPLSVPTRDVLYDAYFGLRSGGDQAWLTGAPVDLDASGYAPWGAGKTGGTGIATLVQKSGSLTVTQYFFAPRALPQAGFVMLARVKNDGASAATGVSVFSIHNFHLGFGRPGVMQDLGENGETITLDASGNVLERAFAGVVAARPLSAPSHRAAWRSSSPATDSGYAIVAGGGAKNLPDPPSGDQPTGDGSVSALQFDLGDLAPGAEGWAGVAFAHHADPGAGATALSALSSYAGAKGPKELLDAEVAEWAAFQASLTVPAGLSADEDTLFRHSAAMLRMAQVREGSSYLRDVLSKDGEPRYTRFPGAKLPGTVDHRGKGAILASLPPGEWTVTWSRDTAYAIVAMATAGMKDEAKAALSFYLNAESGRFQQWDELKPYAMPPYLISLVRYHGFGVEETDFNDFGPNLEFDGFGLFLWALRQYERATGDTSVADAAWPLVSSKVGDALVALVDPATGMVRADSSIWETHWKGRQRSFAYTTITAVRGLCDAAAIAERVGDAARATTYRNTALALRKALGTKCVDPKGALAANLEELAGGEGYRDAAVLDAIAMGLFSPKGNVTKATLASLDDGLLAPAGAGWSRNDDRTDHGGKADLSPWGGEYDSAEWVFTDMRGAIATRLAGDTKRSDRLLAWVRDQSLANYLEVAETYDENAGTYKFNAPMMGFGAGAYMLALAARTAPEDPACGVYFEDGVGGSGGAAGTGGAGGAGGSAGSGAAAGSGGGSAGTSSGGAAQGGTTAAGSGGAAGAASGGKAGGSAGGAAGSSGLVGGGGGAPASVPSPVATDVDNAGPGCGCQLVDVHGQGGALAALLLAGLVARRRRRA